MSKKRPPNRAKKFAFVGVAVVLVGVLVALGIAKYDKKNLNLYGNPTSNSVETTPSQPTQHQLSSNSNSNPGGVIDQNGKTSGNLPPSSQWVSSGSNNITLQQPSPNSVVSSGDELSGTAKVSSVRFILTDNSVGLISQGNLSVSNGKFSGILNFSPHSSSGKLEVYHPNPTNGSEEDIIDINVNFN